MEQLNRKELAELERLDRLSTIKLQSARIKDLDKSKAYDLLMKLARQYSKSDVITVTTKKIVG